MFASYGRSTKGERVLYHHKKNVNVQEVCCECVAFDLRCFEWSSRDSILQSQKYPRFYYAVIVVRPLGKDFTTYQICPNKKQLYDLSNDLYSSLMIIISLSHNIDYSTEKVKRSYETSIFDGNINSNSLESRIQKLVPGRFKNQHLFWQKTHMSVLKCSQNN